jgi:hypothetical protein
METKWLEDFISLVDTRNSAARPSCGTCRSPRSRRIRSLENVDTDVSALYESHACQAVLHAVKARTDERRKHCGMPRPAPPHATSTIRFSPHIARR